MNLSDPMGGEDTATTGPLQSSESGETTRKRWNRYLWLPLALGALAFLLLLVVARASIVSFACGFMLFAAAAYVGRVLSRAHTAEMDAAARAAALPAGSIRDMCAQTLPVWRRQVDSSRSAADTAVADLTRVFGGITEKLENVLASTSLLDAGMIDSREGMLGAIAHSRADLDGLVDALRQMQESKVGIVRDIGAQVASLKENASEMRGIAMQTRILTLNAAIEAARMGAAGAPLAVIVGDMRKLAARSAEASEKISKQTEILNAVESAVKKSADGSGAGSTSIVRAQEVIRGVMTSFQAMTDGLAGAIESMQRERGEVRGDISNALVSLQFQDRVSQILAHVSYNMETLATRLSEKNLHDSDVKAWLAEMSNAYTTGEEFENLREPTRSEAPAGKAITYF